MTETEERLIALQARQEQYAALVHDLEDVHKAAAFGDRLIRDYLQRESWEIDHKLREIDNALKTGADHE
jgi:hypothetical protein